MMTTATYISLPFDSSRMFAMVLECASHKPKAHSDRITTVHFSPDGALIVSGSWDGMIKVWGALRAPNCQPPTSLSDQPITDLYRR